MILLVLPSRGRPLRAAEAVSAAQRLAVLPDTRVVLVIDRDDPSIGDYLKTATCEVWPLRTEQTGNLVRATNTVSLALAHNYPHAVIGNLGDDHVIRTPGWDRMVAEALVEPGMAYGDDLIWGEQLSTAPFISAEIVLALGWYFLPTCQHLFVDKAAWDIAEALGRRHYLPRLVTEHLHPMIGKAEPDDGYLRAESSFVADERAYDDWRRDRMVADVEMLRNVLRAAA